MPRYLWLTLTAITILLVLLSMAEIKTYENLQIQANIEKDEYDSNELIQISGIISYGDGTAVPNAMISIQVVGPNLAVYHIALTYTDGRGEFIDEYYTPEGAPLGIYTVYIKASKVGFGDAQEEIQYSVIPEFPLPTTAILVSMFIILIYYKVFKSLKDRPGS